MSWIYQAATSQEAHLSAYITDNEAEADIVVFLVSSIGLADGPSLWFVDKSKQSARTWVYFAKSPAEADFTVYFTKDKSKAGIRTANDNCRRLR